MSEGPLKLLLIEDHMAHQEAICRYLRNQKLDVFCVSSLAEAKQKIQEIAPSIVLADINLKDGSAFELLSTPKEDMPFPVIVMTSYGDEKMAVQAMKSGAIDYLVKSNETFAMLPQIIDGALREWALLKYRKETMQLLAKREQEFTSLAENLPAIIARVSVDKKILYANPAFTGCWIVEPALEHTILFGTPITEIKLLPSIASVLDDMLTISIHGISTSFRQIDIEKDGNKICYDILTIPERNIDNSSVSSVLVIAFDVTFHKRAEEAIRESEIRFRELAELMPACIAEVNRDGTITYMNQNGIKLFGYSEEEILSGEVKLQNLFLVSERTRIEALLKEKSTGKFLRSYEYKAMPKDGKPLTVLLRVALLKKRNTASGLCCLIFDISDQKIREEQMLEASKLVTLGTLVAGVAHEINNPTQFITMNAPLIQELTVKLANEIDGLLPVIPKNSHSATARIQEIIKDIQTLLDGVVAGGIRISRIVENFVLMQDLLMVMFSNCWM